MNLSWCLVRRRGEAGRDQASALHLDQERLELTPERGWGPDELPRHERPHIGQHIAEGGVEDEAVDGFVEGL